MGHQKKSYKKFVATAATATLVASAIVPVASASFSDVTETNEFATYINTAVEAGYVKGYADGTFGLNDNLKRSQVVIIIGRYLESLGYTSQATTSPWSDVTDAEVIKYGNIVKDAEVFTGYADGTLNGAGLITRENMAVVLDRLAKTVTGTSLSEVAAEIEDVKVADLATANANYQGSIQALRDLGISTADNFNPKGNVKRGQFAKFIVTAVENINAIEVAPEVTAEDIAKEIATVDATLPAVAYIKADNAVAAKTAVEAAKTAIAVIEAKIAEVEFTAEEVAGLEKAITAVEAKYEAIVKAADKAIEDAKQLAVESVKVLNATQVEVKFSKAVKESTIVNEGKLVANTVVIKSLDEKAVDLADATAELSKDGKTLVITSATVVEGRYDITIEKITDADDKVMTKYEVKNVDFGKDTVAPTISNVEKVNASTVKVTFSEPLSAVGKFTFKDAEGKDVNVNASELDANKVSVTLTIDGEVKAGTQIIATVIGAKDKAGNLLSPNPATFSFVKGDKDGVAPTVTNATAQGLNKFELTFSEEVQDLAVTDIKVDGVDLDADNATLVQDKENKTKYAVTLTDALAEGVHTISLAKAVATDLSGEELAAFSKVVEFKADKVAPKFVSSEVVTEVVNNQPVEKLVLTFDKEVVDPDALTVDSAKQVNADLVTTTGKLTADFALNAKNEKQVYVYLKDVKFAEADLVKGATYTFTAAKGSVEDASSNEAAAFTVSFKRTEDGVQTTTAPKVEKVTASPTNANELTVEFDKVVDGATATNVANYSIPGLVVEDATLNPAEDGKQTVTLKIKDGSNTLDGDRQITIKNVKAKDGEVMEEQILTVAGMLENVAPVVASAKFSKTEAGKVTEITLTFSEAVTVEANAFELFVGDATTATTTAAVETKATTAVIKVTNGLTTEDIAKAITVKLADNKEVLDANNNVLKAFSVKAGY